MFYQNELRRLYEEVKEEKEKVDWELKGMPEGTLTQRYRYGKTYYYLRTPSGGNHKRVHRYSLLGKDDMIKTLLRKNYLQDASVVLEHDINVFRTAVQQYAPFDAITLQQDSMERFSGLGKEYFDLDAGAWEWAQDYEQDFSVHPEHLVNEMADGTLVRSKSEAYIISRLKHYKIPYRYEDRIEELGRLPDFTIIRPRDHKKIYWEHAGMIFKKEYQARHLRKMEQFEAIGIVPWDNLIVTYDNENEGIDAAKIDAYIKYWILQESMAS